jgi:hypothetical protein
MSSMTDNRFELREAVCVLEQTPAAVAALLGNLPPPWLTFQEQPEAWSPLTVLIHFIHNERANWIPRARVILAADGPRQLPPFRQMPENATEAGQSIAELLREFAHLRDESLAVLRGFDLQPSDLEREAVHPVLGRVNLRQLLATWLVHDLNHIQQIAKTLAQRYGDEVGPWRQYLAILDM